MRQDLIFWETHWKDAKNKAVVHKELVRVILDSLDISGRRILEVGAGLGGDIMYLVNKGAKGTVVDFSKTSLSRIEKLAKEKQVPIEIIRSNARTLPFKDETFDLVFHQGLLEHFTNSLPILKEQKRVLKRRGYILVDVPHKYNLYTLYKHWKMMRNRWITPWETEFGKKDLVELLKKAGFVPQKSYYRTFYPPGFGKIIKGKLPTKLRCFVFLNRGIFHWALKFFGQRLESSPLRIFYYQNVGVVAQKL
jgi:ubiquinone/menaquinone biosynthesis C-methylase UbiE